MPNQIGQAYGLMVLSPLTAGDEHVRDVRAFIRSITETGSPFARIPTIHTARWVVLDDVAREGGHFHEDVLASKYLVLDVNLDTDARGLDGFLRDMAEAMPVELTTIYSHCVGFPGVADVDAFVAYIKRCQIETTFFFTDYASENRGKVVNVKRALDVQARFVALVEALQSRPAAETRREVEGLLRGLDWTLPPLPVATHAATAPPRTLTRQRVELRDVQGNVIRAYKFPLARHLCFRVVDAALAKKGLAVLAPRVAHSGSWSKKPESALNIAFSCAGLKALDVSARTLEGFPVAFQMGMRTRAEILGDTGSSAPEQWDVLWKDTVHVMVSVYAEASATLLAEAARVIDTLAGGAICSGHEDAAQLREDGALTRKEHFGFVDGLGTTDIDGTGLQTTPGSGKLDADGHWVGLAPGELLFGYRDEADEFPDTPNPPELVRNGTFMIFRKLREHVGTFRTYLKEANYPGGEDLLAAKIVGRFRDGTPLALSAVPSPEIVADDHRNNAFLYGDDPNGAKCPMSAHIRRSRPRDALGFDGRITDRRRLQRRGMPYGPPLPTDAREDDVDRGIVFLAFAIDIERQFEFVQQQWLNYGNSFRQSNDRDILSGNHDGAGKAVIQATEGGAPFVCAGLPRFVDMRGGDYFFVPGLRALRALAGD